MIFALIAAAMAATAVPTATAAPRAVPDARPALWVVNDEDTIIYLFGTFHALDGRSAWFNDEVKTAFAASDELVLETLVPKPFAVPEPQGKPTAGKRTHPVPALGSHAGSASFLSTSKTIMSAGRSQGMSTDHGADSVLRQAAEDIGKPVGGLETFEFQMGIFSSLPGSSKPTSPQQSQAVNAALGSLLSVLQAAWNRGDVETFTPMLEDMRARSPHMYKVMFTDRNQRWAGWIANRLQQPGTVFVAVGAGHLAGKDSVQHKLAEGGIRTERLN